MMIERPPREIKNRITSYENIYWRKCEVLQPEGFKELSDEAYSKLRHSIIENGFIEPFRVWRDNGATYVIDGVHRIKVLDILVREGYNIPEEFPAEFISCRDRAEAAKFVLVYSSIYAQILEHSLFEFSNTEQLDLRELNLEISIPGIDLEVINLGHNDGYGEPDDGPGGEEKKTVCPECGAEF